MIPPGPLRDLKDGAVNKAETWRRPASNRTATISSNRRNADRAAIPSFINLRSIIDSDCFGLVGSRAPGSFPVDNPLVPMRAFAKTWWKKLIPNNLRKSGGQEFESRAPALAA
jgi:hypothetical protein